MSTSRTPKPPKAPLPSGSDKFVGTEDDIAFPDKNGKFPPGLLDPKIKFEGVDRSLMELADRLTDRAGRRRAKKPKK